MNPLRITLTALLALLGAGCAPMSPYYGNTIKHPQESLQNREGCSVAFIEFGEQGSYQDPTQLQLALDTIKRTPRPLVVTYVHGWQNNARSGDAEKFADFLRTLSDSDVVRKAHFNVIGVYLGWRGQLTKVPVAKYLTFFSRKAAAERLASNFDCYDAIAAVSEAARKNHASDGQYTVLLGHSFGGLVVERSVAHAINAAIHTDAEPAKSLPADLILLLNPASDSILTRQMIAALYSRHLEDTREFIVSLTSTADAATGLAFPAGENLAAFTKGFNRVRVPGLAGQIESERDFYTHTPGHNPRLLNHETEDLRQVTPANGEKAFDANLSAHAPPGHDFVTDDGAGNFRLWRFKPVGDATTPYWDVAVDPAIISDHGDIWNPRVQAMMAAIFRMNILGDAPAHPHLARASRETATSAIQTKTGPADLHRAPDFNRLDARPAQ